MKFILSLFFLSLAIFSMAQDVNLPSEQVWAERVSGTKYILRKQGKKKWKIFQGSTPSQINWAAKPMVLADTLSLAVSSSDRLFFAAIQKKDTLIFSERRLWFDAMPNFRDLGGLKTTTGRTVAWNKLFRCGDMGQLSEQDLQTLYKLGVKNVVDFRNDQEVSRSPDKYPTQASINRVWTSISASNSPAMTKFYQVMSDPSVTAAQVETLFEGFYASMPEQVKNYTPFFKTLLEQANQGATVYHCTAGKDRTGLASVLVLSALGVAEEDIVNEYYLSNRYTRDALAKSSMMSMMKPEVAAVLAGVKPQYIQATLNTIKQKYGSVVKMLEVELEIGAAERQRLIEYYTY